MTTTVQDAASTMAQLLGAAGIETSDILPSVPAPIEAVAAVAEPATAENPDDFVEVPATRIDLLETSARIHLSNGMKKMISHGDLAHTVLSFLNKAQESREGTIRMLPSNVYMIEESIDQLTLCFYFPEKVQNVNFNEQILPRVTPNIVMNVQLSRGSGSKKNDFTYGVAYYYATNLSLSRLPSGVIRQRGKGISILPFTNVYPEANLCTGYNTLIKNFPNNDLRQTIWFHDMLWASPFNYDLGVSAIGTEGRARAGIDAWYAELARRAKAGEGFPYDKLIHLN